MAALLLTVGTVFAIVYGLVYLAITIFRLKEPGRSAHPSAIMASILFTLASVGAFTLSNLLGAS